jgi:ADP-dependent NAD(P)H-hydrate dehydratase / NAD(P)H-hydrate epimerase
VDVAALLPEPPADSDKYRRGIVADGDRFTGRRRWPSAARCGGGTGMVWLVSAPAAVAVVREGWPEAVVTVTGEDAPGGEEPAAAGRVKAWVAGPGHEHR